MVDSSTLFQLLAAVHRRRILLMLCDVETIEVPTGLQTRSAARPRGQNQSRHAADEPDPTPTDSERDTLEDELLHWHLPKLESEGLIQWDRGSMTVSRGPDFEEVEPVLHVLAANATQFPDDLF